MKILLIKTEQQSPIDYNICSPLGVLYLAAVAEKLGHQVRVLDLRLYPKPKQIGRLLVDSLAWKPDVVGLSAITPFADTLATVGRFYRRRLSDALVLAGGPHGSTDNEDILTNELVHACVHGEGERVFQHLLELREQGKDFREARGISYLADDKVIENPPAPLIENLDEISLPAWHLIDFKPYRAFLNMSSFSRSSATMFTSRGCPYHCIYCHNFFGKAFRARSPENVLSEVELLRNRYGMKNIEFVDDIFNLDRERAALILQGIAERFPDVSIAFPNGLRGDLLDEDMIRLLKKARTWHVSIAVETASERLQKMLKKNINLEKMRETARLLRKHKIFTRGFFMIGFPTETREEIERTARYFIESDINYGLFFIVTPYNKTELQALVPPEKMQAFSDQKGHFDYQWGDLTISDIPYEELENIQVRYYRKGFLRLRTLPLFYSAFVGVLKKIFMQGDFSIVPIALNIALGLRKDKRKKNALDIRLKRSVLLADFLGVSVKK